MRGVHTRPLTWAARLLEHWQCAQHAHLESTDSCWFLAEYRAGSYSSSDLNQTIANLKCGSAIAAAHPARRYYRQRAVEVVAGALRRHFERGWVEAATWVPIPTSGGMACLDQDDRLVRTLSVAFGDYDLDLRLLLRQTAPLPADHAAAHRVSAQKLWALLEVDTVALRGKPLRQRVILFDDLLTSGKHFKCCQRRLRDLEPLIPIWGCFVARRVLPARWHGLPAS